MHSTVFVITMTVHGEITAVHTGYVSRTLQSECAAY